MEKKTDSIIKFKPRRTFGSLVAATAVAALMVPTMAFAAVGPDIASYGNAGVTGTDARDQAIEWAGAVDNVGKTEYWLQLEKGSMGKISVDVPVRVVLAVNADGTFVTPTALKNVIENDSEIPVNVKSISITPRSGFALKAATGFDALADTNIFNGVVKSVAGDNVNNVKQSVAFTKLEQYDANTAWAMKASDSVASPTERGTADDPAEKTGEDCLFVQIDGALGNVAGHYFTAPINVFDLTYTFEASPATSLASTDTTTLVEPVNISD